MSRHPGILIALGAALLGASTPLAKLALSSAHPLLVAGLLYLGSGIGLAVVRKIRSGRSPSKLHLTAGRPSWLAGAILAGGVVGPALIIAGADDHFGKHRFSLTQFRVSRNHCYRVDHLPGERGQTCGRGLRVDSSLGASCFHCRRKAGLRSPTGALLITAACLCWGIDNNLTRKISGSDPSQIAMWKGLVAGFRGSRHGSPQQARSCPL